ncbi:MAG: hypothetical protein MZU97_04950 [Bacillus subtilis]|nr:hypothetical protein [Bacillus subtilis]
MMAGRDQARDRSCARSTSIFKMSFTTPPPANSPYVESLARWYHQDTGEIRSSRSRCFTTRRVRNWSKT